MAAAEIRMVHALPGRVRLKVAGLRNNPSLARVIEKRLGVVAGVQEVTAAPITGSVLVLFDPLTVSSPASLLTLSETLTDLFPGLDLAQLGDFLASSREEDLDVPSWYQTGMDFLVGLNARLAQGLGGLMSFRVLLPLALLWFGLPILLDN